MGIDLKGMGGDGKDSDVSMDTESSSPGNGCTKECCPSSGQAGNKVAPEVMEDNVRANGFSLSSHAL